MKILYVISVFVYRTSEMSFLRISVMVVLLALSAAGAFLTFEQVIMKMSFTW